MFCKGLSIAVLHSTCDFKDNVCFLGRKANGEEGGAGCRELQAPNYKKVSKVISKNIIKTKAYLYIKAGHMGSHALHLTGL